MNERRIALLLAAACLACASAPREGESVHIAEESAIILWDAATKTQHFIRRASFDTKAKDFGFLVPTPSGPTLGEADDAAFKLLESITEPPRAPQSAAAPRQEVASAAHPRVEVLARRTVAGLDAAVLKANDAGALDAWLKGNGYRSSPELADWYKPYIEKNWIITAFKIATGGAARVEAQAVRMSFQTERPFFPYREPAGAAGPADRLLNVYYVGDTRVEGRIGAEGRWSGVTMWSGILSDDQTAKLRQLLKLPEAKTAARLTHLADNAAPRRAADDVYFVADTDQSEIREPDAQTPNLGLAMLVAAAVTALILWMRARSQRRRGPTSGRP